MTEFVDVNVQSALLTQLTNPDLGYPVAFPLVPYTPTDGVAFLQVWPLMSAEPLHPSLDYSGYTRSSGIFQVDAVMPDGQGEAPGLRITAKVAERFAIGTTLTAGARKLQINKVPKVSAWIKEGAWVRFPVSITYQIITP